MDPKIEMEVKMGLSSAEAMGKHVLFPEVRRFEELFEEFRVIQSLSSYRSWYVCSWKLDEGGEAHLSSSCTVSHPVVFLHLDVTPFEHVYDAVEKSMFLSKGYVINFSITVRGDTALVSAKYDRILGDRWFAIIETSSIPGLEGALAQEAADEKMVEDLETPAGEPAVIDLFMPNEAP